MSFWDNCEPNEEQSVFLGEIENIILASRQSTAQNTTIPLSSQSVVTHKAVMPIYEAFNSLTEVETMCSSFLYKLDEILEVLDEISTSHEEITGRTNVLMMNCESLLEQQVAQILILSPLSNMQSSSLFSSPSPFATLLSPSLSLSPFTSPRMAAA
jgi:hypothetical protein